MSVEKPIEILNDYITALHEESLGKIEEVRRGAFFWGGVGFLLSSYNYSIGTNKVAVFLAVAALVDTLIVDKMLDGVRIKEAKRFSDLRKAVNISNKIGELSGR